MYLSANSRPIDFYNDEAADLMMMDTANNNSVLLSQQMILAESSCEDHETRAPRKRAETWVMEEIQSLINFRRELDDVFNSSKSNKLLWEQISAKMRDNGFDRSPSMCTDKWRNLLKEFKKAKGSDFGFGSIKMLSYYTELEAFHRERKRSAPQRNYSPSRVDSYMQYSERDGGRLTLNQESNLNNDNTHSLVINEAEPSNVPSWNWRETPVSGLDNDSAYSGRVISVKLGECTRRIGIDGSSDAIKEAIKSSLGLRTKRAFWLEDENEIVRTLHRDMPLGAYTLHLDEGLTIKLCLYDDPNQIPVHTEEKTFYSDADFRDFLNRRGWIGLKDLTCYRIVDALDDLQPGEMYQGLRMMES